MAQTETQAARTSEIEQAEVAHISPLEKFYISADNLATKLWDQYYLSRRPKLLQAASNLSCMCGGCSCSKGDSEMPRPSLDLPLDEFPKAFGQEEITEDQWAQEALSLAVYEEEPGPLVDYTFIQIKPSIVAAIVNGYDIPPRHQDAGIENGTHANTIEDLFHQAMEKFLNSGIYGNLPDTKSLYTWLYDEVQTMATEISDGQPASADERLYDRLTETANGHRWVPDHVMSPVEIRSTLGSLSPQRDLNLILLHFYAKMTIEEIAKMRLDNPTQEGLEQEVARLETQINAALVQIRKNIEAHQIHVTNLLAGYKKSA